MMRAAEGERAYHLYYFMLHGSTAEEKKQYSYLARLLTPRGRWI